MSDWQKANKHKFFHIGRGAEIVTLKDRDVFAFIPEVLSFTATSGLTITRGTNTLWTGSIQCGSSERVLTWARVSGSNLATSFRWVPYITSDDPDTTTILPLREIYSPKVSYDRTSNMLSLWFWTNVPYDYNSAEYDEAHIIPTGFDGYDTLMTDEECTVKRVLCFATGQFIHAKVNGGLIGTFTGQTTLDETFDIIPVFSKPKIISNFVTSTVSDNPGMVTDGWYGGAGGGGDEEDGEPGKGSTAVNDPYIPIVKIIAFVNQKPYVSGHMPGYATPVGAGIIQNWPVGNRILIQDGQPIMAWITASLSLNGDYNHTVTFNSGAAFPAFVSPPSPPHEVWRTVLWCNGVKRVVDTPEIGDWVYDYQFTTTGEVSFFVP
jgi:hypothetical protein